MDNTIEQYKNQAFDIILTAGQSNAFGYGKGPGDKYEEDDDILYLMQDMTICRAYERYKNESKAADFALTFAKRYKESGLLSPGRKLLIVRSAVGGTGFANHHWGMHDDFYLQMMEMIRLAISLNSVSTVRAFLWHQGETDALHAIPRETHYTNLTALLRSVRDEVKDPALPFICGDFCHEWRRANLENCLPVIRAIIDTCIDAGHARFVLTDDLPSNHEMDPESDDTIHFSRKALAILGERYFDAYRDLSGR